MRHNFFRAREIWLAVAVLIALLVNGPSFAASCCHASQPGDCVQPASYEGERVALIVGVSQYNGPRETAGNGLVDLENATKDATDMAGILSPHYSVRCVLNPNGEQFLNEIETLKAHLKAVQVTESRGYINSVILHFSGHGSRLNNSDHIFLSGRYTTLNDAINRGAVPVSHILGEFRNFPQFEKTFIFDACRNFTNTGTVVKPTWLQNGFGKPEDHSRARTWQAIVYATEPGHFAYDKNESIGATENGAFVFILKKYLKLGIPLQDIIKMLPSDRALTRIEQAPDSHWSDLFERVSWTRQMANVCGGFEALAAVAANSCRRPNGNWADCMKNKREICDPFRKMEPAGCPTAALLNLFPEISCPAQIAANPFGVVPIASLAGSTLAEMRRVAALASAQQRFDARPASGRGPASTELLLGFRGPTISELARRSVTAAVDQLNTIAGDLGRSSAPPDQVAKVRTQILAKGRSSTAKAFNAGASASFQAPQGDIELYNVPGLSGGTTGRLKPTGPVKTDCQTQYCDSNWVAARVPVGKTTVDGWLPADQVTVRRFASAIDVPYDGEDVVPTVEGRTRLKNFVRETAAKKMTL